MNTWSNSIECTTKLTFYISWVFIFLNSMDHSVSPPPSSAQHQIALECTFFYLVIHSNSAPNGTLCCCWVRYLKYTYFVTPRIRVLLENISHSPESRNFPPDMEHDDSTPHSQWLASTAAITNKCYSEQILKHSLFNMHTNVTHPVLLTPSKWSLQVLQLKFCMHISFIL